ncbi:MAG: Isoprenylcysteine carboxyl methyltransferase family protein [Fluviicola sp.]|nr:Isoprenylcysteine carboxyl methyltransferase family protein [Fluviicola sp.]
MFNTEIHTFKTPQKLVTHGLFKYSRNPIYLGFVIALFGVWILLSGNLFSLFGVMFFFLIANFGYIPYEEKQMETIFGQEYLAYKNKVRRWI